MVAMFVAEQRTGRVDLLRTKHRDISTLDDLRAAAQLAIQVEFTTIPAYLTALYSISDRTSAAYQVVRSVVMEEMFHVNQAANILIGVGGAPVFTGDVVPKYPTYLPSANKDRTPYVGLYRASPAVFRNVFMGIETPAPFAAPPEGSEYKTIGQLYAALRDGIATCVRRYGEYEVFKQADGARQRVDIYLGKFGGKAIRVDSLKSAHAAIEQIVHQGEGAVTMQGTLIDKQPFGAYHHYGDRADGTYGPILGTPLEDSHYVKFLSVSGSDGFPDTFPIVSNPKISDYTNDEAIKKAKAFNKAYSLMLHTLQGTFEQGDPGADPYFSLTLPLMHSNLAHLAYVLMNTPTNPDGSSSVGPNAAPTFEYDPHCTFDDVLGALAEIKGPSAPRAAASFEAAVRAAPPAMAKPPIGGDLIDKLIHNFEDLKARAQNAGIRL